MCIIAVNNLWKPADLVYWMWQCTCFYWLTSPCCDGGGEGGGVYINNYWNGPWPELLYCVLEQENHSTLSLCLSTREYKMGFTSNFRVLGIRSMNSLPPNEPPTNLAKNSVDLQELHAEIQRIHSECLEIPCIVGGKEVYSGNTRYQVAVSECI